MCWNLEGMGACRLKNAPRESGQTTPVLPRNWKSQPNVARPSRLTLVMAEVEVSFLRVFFTFRRSSSS